MKRKFIKQFLALPLAIVLVAEILVGGLGVGVVPVAAKKERDYVSLVNPWVEADIARYFFFQSASNPFGFVKLRPDTSTQSRRVIGYGTTENEVKGFSHIHDWQFSGVQVMPTSGQSVPKTEGDTGWQSHVEHDDSEIAEPGYHKLHLDRYNITAELTVTDRVGLHRYTYGEGGPSEIIINLGGTLGEAVMKDAHVTKISNHEIEGFVVQHGGDYTSLETRLFFNIRFDKPFDSLHGWSNGRLAEGGVAIDELSGDNMGVYVRYDHLDAGETIQMKVGLSLTGVEGARKNLETELPGWDFDAVKQASQDNWNEMLGRIDVRGGTEEQQIKFYTDLFHVLCGRSVISDVDGKYLDNTWGHQKVKRIPLDNHGKPKFAMYNYDALWLTQWNLNTILGLAYPEVYSSFVQSQLQMYEDGGLLPRGPVAGNYSLIMSSSPVTSFISGAWNKGIRDFNPDLAYEAMLDAHSVGGLFDKAEREHETWGGNGGIRQYLDLGYVPYDLTGPGRLSGAGQTLEYAFQDWTLAQMARQLEKKGLNVSQFAEVTVSSQANEASLAGVRAIDGRPIRSGYSNDGNNVEWASDGESNPWIKLAWDEPQRIQKVVLSDRADTTINVNAGILKFSDGSSVTVTDIPDDGSEKVVSFTPKSGVTWVKFEVTGGEGTSVGLNEIEVWDDRDMYTYLLKRSRNWRNLFDESIDFIRPKSTDGQWLEPFNPLSGTDFVQANSWQSTWYTPHDVMGLANLMGGRVAYADKLNYAFEQSVDNNFIAQHGQGYVSYGNQPGLVMAHLFNYVGKPWLSQYWVRQVKEKTYGSISTTDGYGHHDEDQGQMGAISALMAMGLFEVTGGSLSRPVYDITSPIFDEITIQLNQDYYKGKEFRIITHNNSATNMYIQRAKLNGEPLDSAWFYHDQLADGGTLELWMSDEPNKEWGVDDLPPSASEEKEQTLATEIEIIGPDLIEAPYSTVQLDARVTPENTSYKRVEWSVTNTDGSPTDKATVDYFGVLTVNDKEGDILITARAADGGGAIASKTVTIDLDLTLLRGNAARWPNVSATASSEYSDNYAAEKVFDGIIGSKDSGDWASQGERNPWIQLDWEEPITADKIVLFDRPDQDSANSGTLTFSDGSSVDVSDIAPDGSATTVKFDMKTFEWVRLQIEGGTGRNPGLSEFEVYAVPSVPDKPTQVSSKFGQAEATISWQPPAFDGGAPLTGYVVRTYRDGVLLDEVTVDENTTQTVVTNLSTEQSYEFTVAATNLAGTGPEMREMVYATDIHIVGPDLVEEPYSSVRFDAEFAPEDTALKMASWSVTEPDGSPTDKAVIDDEGVLTVNHRNGDVLVTATAADARGVSVSKTVTLELDATLLRGNAARWPGVTATASSEYNYDYRAEKVHDGIIGQWRVGEWASRGEQNPWVQLDWDKPIQADKIVLYDRSIQENVNGGTLTFSDGSSIPVTDVPQDGSPKTITFEMKTFDWVRFQVEGGTGPNVGLSEFEVFAVPSVPDAPIKVSAIAGVGEAIVSWDFPQFDGGAPVTGYVVTPYQDGVPLESVTVEEGTTQVAITGLSFGQSYQFTVAATNLIGTGPETSLTDTVTPGTERVADMKTLIERFEEEGEFANHGAARSLQVHLTAVSRYEEKELAEKVVKHMESFKLLLDHQKEKELISKNAHNILKTSADYVIKKWQ